jgi:metal-dependent hydrolase (beta-lactamase superfamily II)
MKKTFAFAALLLLLPSASFTQKQPIPSPQPDLDALTQAMNKDTLLRGWVDESGGPAVLLEGFRKSLRASDSLWRHDQAHITPMREIGSTKKFELIPLIDWFTADSGLTGESGVAYLIRTDDATVLFDVGLNRHDTDPSPLLKNMNRLGVKTEEIDAIVISHPHGDHVGGKWGDSASFSLTSRRIDLAGKKVYTPIPMKYPGVDPVCSRAPVKLAKGVATIGLIDCPLFLRATVEQALAVNVEGKGIVIVSGCGHQTVEKILQRTERLFPVQLYALLGGLHLPLVEGRNIRAIRYFLTGRVPGRYLTPEDIEQQIKLMKQHGVRVIGISGHDSCDSTITMFRSAFGDSYRDIAVGRKITIP